MVQARSDNLQGTLALLVLKSLEQEPMHGWGITLHIQRISNEVLRVEEGSLYPALHRMEQEGWIASEWGLSENNRRARFYRLTAQGRRQLTSRARELAKDHPGSRAGFGFRNQHRHRSIAMAWISRLRALFRRDKLARRAGRGARLPPLHARAVECRAGHAATRKHIATPAAASAILPYGGSA